MKPNYVGAVVVGLMCTPLGALADVYNEGAMQAAVLPTDESGLTKVVFLFDLAGLRKGANMRIEEATLDWRISDLGENQRSVYTAHAITKSWVAARIFSGEELTYNPDSISEWELIDGNTANRLETAALTRSDGTRALPRHRVNGEGLARLEITALVEDWAKGVRANYGVLVTAGNVTRDVLERQVGKARLTIRYGFRME